MTIEVLKNEAVKLTKLEKLQFLQFLADMLSEEEQDTVLSLQQKQILLHRLEAVKSGNAILVPAEKVKENLIQKHGLRN
jgi:putative addiction module component (TIGR02574 family)